MLPAEEGSRADTVREVLPRPAPGPAWVLDGSRAMTRRAATTLIVTATGVSPVLAGSGTGAYRDMSGTFVLTITVHEVDSWPGCTALLAETIYMAGSGTVSIG